MAVIWTLNGAAQSAVWSPLLRLTVERLPGVEAMRASVRYSTTVPFGTLAAYGLAALCFRNGLLARGGSPRQAVPHSQPR